MPRPTAAFNPASSSARSNRKMTISTLFLVFLIAETSGATPSAGWIKSFKRSCYAGNREQAGQLCTAASRGYSYSEYKGSEPMRISRTVVPIIVALFLTLTTFAVQKNQILDLNLEPSAVLKQQKGLAYVDKDTRVNYIALATLWKPVDLDQIDARAGRQILDSDGLNKILPNDSTVECRYVQEPAGGTTEKFHCDFVQATDSNNNPIKIHLKKLKVRYNSFKTVSDVIISRLAWMLGFGS